MRILHRLVLTGTVLLSGACGGDSAALGPSAPVATTLLPVAAAPSPPAVGATAYDVYRAVFGQRAAPSNGHPIVVLEETGTSLGCSPSIGSSFGEEWQSAIADYTGANAAPQRILSGADLGIPFVALTTQQYREIFVSSDLEASWRRFRDTYPSGTLVKLSAVGFSTDRTRAVVQLASSCGSLCGGLRDYYLVKAGSAWTVTPLQTCSAVS